jgi:hypothetical protein
LAFSVTAVSLLALVVAVIAVIERRALDDSYPP